MVHSVNEGMRESEQVLFGVQSVFERDNASLIVVSVAQRFKFNAEESIVCGTGRAPSCQRSNEWEGVLGAGEGKWEVDVFSGQTERILVRKTTKQQIATSFI